MSPSADSQLARWTVPDCPFAIDYAPRVLDDIRMAVVDAYFSLPRGGAEIGGLLLGRRGNGRLLILASAPLECEHAFGPSFTLSQNDLQRLHELIDANGNDPDALPVGWYHSHTRTEIFLSETDVEIHKRFFPERWQVALVLKPHMFMPVRAGFFFTAADGTMHGDGSSGEFQLEPLPVRPLPSLAAAAPSPLSPMSQSEGEARVIDVPAGAVEVSEPEPEPEPAAESMPQPIATEFAGFSLLQPGPEAPRRRVWAYAAAGMLGIGLAFAGYQLRPWWMPRIAAAFQPPNPVQAAALGLTTAEQDGRLQIRWNPATPAVGRSSGGILLIADGAEPHSFPLDTASLKAGSFAYTCATGRVNVTLSVSQPNGQKLVQTATFIGKPPEPPAAAAPIAAPAAVPPEAAPPTPAPAKGPGKPCAVEAELRRQRDVLRDENARLRANLARQAEAIKRLEKYIEDDRRDHQRKRLENQSPEGKMR